MTEERMGVPRREKLVKWEQSDTRSFSFSLSEQVGFLEFALGEEWCSNPGKKGVSNWGSGGVIDSGWWGLIDWRWRNVTSWCWRGIADPGWKKFASRSWFESTSNGGVVPVRSMLASRWFSTFSGRGIGSKDGVLSRLT